MLVLLLLLFTMAIFDKFHWKTYKDSIFDNFPYFDVPLTFLCNKLVKKLKKTNKSRKGQFKGQRVDLWLIFWGQTSYWQNTNWISWTCYCIKDEKVVPIHGFFWQKFVSMAWNLRLLKMITLQSGQERKSFNTNWNFYWNYHGDYSLY